jgi:hypothetical protein
MRDMMTKISELESLLAAIGPMAARDAVTAMEDVTQFQALSFFHPGEVISTKILSYLLDPHAPHGHNYIFLEAFLNALAIDLGGKELKCASVQTNALCYTQSPPRRMDILLLFSAGADDFAVVVESKSHGAGDQKDQIRDYLEHIQKAYRRRRKFIFYLNDGKPPGPKSIPPLEWEKAHKEGICHTDVYRVIMQKWCKESLAKCRAEKLRHFVEDFAAFSWKENRVNQVQSSVGRGIQEIVEQKAEYTETSSKDSDHFDALLAIYDLHDETWMYAVRLFMNRVREILEEQLPEWTAICNFEDGNLCVELGLFPKGINPKDPLIGVYLATEWEAKSESESQPCAPMYFVLYIRKSTTLPAPLAVEFNPSGLMWIGPKKGDFWKRERPLGIADIKSADGLRSLVTEQAAQGIATTFRNFATENWEKIANSAGI